MSLCAVALDMLAPHLHVCVPDMTSHLSEDVPRQWSLHIRYVCVTYVTSHLSEDVPRQWLVEALTVGCQRLAEVVVQRRAVRQVHRHVVDAACGDTREPKLGYARACRAQVGRGSNNRHWPRIPERSTMDLAPCIPSSGSVTCRVPIKFSWTSPMHA